MQKVYWRSFKGISYFGTPGEFEPFFPGGSAELLLVQLMGMRRGIPLSYQEACRTVQIESQKQLAIRNNDPEVKGSAGWLMRHWPEWLESLGYHVELVGDEFEIVSDFKLQ